MKNQILNILKQFDSLPFIFVGSGLSIRYLDLDNWEGLLRKFASLASNQEFGYELYYQKAERNSHKEGIMPKVSELIEDSFNEVWFTSEIFKESRVQFKDEINRNVSPFKLEISKYMIDKSKYINEDMLDEIESFKNIGKKCIVKLLREKSQLI